MGVETDKLVAACKEGVKKIADAQKGADDSLKSFGGAVKRAEDLPDDADPKVLDKSIEGALTERMFAKNAVNMIEIRAAATEKAAKDLEAKVKTKNMLDFFKTQKSLEDAKKVLTSTQQTVAAARKKSAAGITAFNGLDLKLTAESDRVVNLVKEREVAASAADKVLKALQRFQSNTVGGATKVFKNILGALAGQRKDLAKNQAELKSRKTWSDGDHKKRLAELRTDFTELETIQSQLDELVNNVKTTRDKIDIGPVKANPEVKKAWAKAVADENNLQAAATKAREDALDIASDVQELLTDMGLAVVEGQGGDQRAEARVAAAGAAADKIEVLAITLKDSPTLGVFGATLDDIKRDTPFLATGLPTGARWVAKDWVKFDSIARTLAANEKLVGAQYPAMLRSEKQAQAIFNRFKDDDDVKAQWKIAQTAAAEKKKQYADLQKVLPGFKGILAKLQAVHP